MNVPGQQERNPWDWTETGKACPACLKQILIRTNRQTQRNFLGCSGYPICRWTYSAYGYGGLARGMSIEAYLKTLADFGLPISVDAEEPAAVKEPPSDVSAWVSDFLERNEAFVDSVFRALGALNGNATREGRGGFDRKLIEAEILRQLTQQAEKK